MPLRGQVRVTRQWAGALLCVLAVLFAGGWAGAQSFSIGKGSTALRGSLSESPIRTDTWYVDASATPPGSGTYLDPYVDLATMLVDPKLAPGDTILVEPGTYPGPLVAPPFGVTVRAVGGLGGAIVDAQFAGPALALSGTDGTPTCFSGFIFRNGIGTAVSPIFSAGGGVQVQDAVYKLTDCRIELNDAFWGGGVYAKNSVGTLTDCEVLLNTNTGFAARGAGVMVDGGALLLSGCTVRQNASGDFFAPGTGGGVYAQGAVDLDAVDCLIEQNIAEFGGGGTYGPGDYFGCTLRLNIGQFGGGANATSGTSFTDCLFEANEADSLGGTSHFGGGVYGPAVLTGCTFKDNLAWGGIAGADGALVVDSVFTANLAIPGYGGVNELSGGVGNALVLTSTFEGNVADGGDLYAAAGGAAQYSTLVDCDLLENQARPSPTYLGGGAYQCDIRRSRLRGNATSGSGGGAFGGTLKRCLIWDNQAEAGGGVANSNLDHCTLEGNSAALADGIWMNSGSNASVSDCIVYGNQPEEIMVDPSGAVAVTYSDVEGGFVGVGNIDVDPRFWNPEADDFHLRLTSACIDAGDPSYALDPDGTITDMGALRADPNYNPDGNDPIGASGKP